jgi:hypothetical protein
MTKYDRLLGVNFPRIGNLYTPVFTSLYYYVKVLPPNALCPLQVTLLPGNLASQRAILLSILSP